MSAHKREREGESQRGMGRVRPFLLMYVVSVCVCVLTFFKVCINMCVSVHTKLLCFCTCVFTHHITGDRKGSASDDLWFMANTI